MAQNTVGVAYFRLNGVQYAIAGDMRINALSERRTPLIGIDGNVVAQVEFQSPSVECSVKDLRDVDLVAISKMEGATVTVEMGNGTIWELSDAFYSGEGELDAREGNFQVRFNGRTIRRII